MPFFSIKTTAAIAFTAVIVLQTVNSLDSSNHETVYPLEDSSTTRTNHENDSKVLVRRITRRSTKNKTPKFKRFKNLRRMMSTRAPSATPSSCADSALEFKVDLGNNEKDFKTCDWVARKPKTRCDFDGVKSTCPDTCGKCSRCKDSPLRLKFIKDGETQTQFCDFIANKKGKRCQIPGIRESCRATCDSCAPPYVHIPNTYCNNYYERNDEESCENGDPFDIVWEKCLNDGDKCMGVQWNSCDEDDTSNIEVNGAWKLLSQGQDIGDADHPTLDCGGKEQALGHWDVFVKRSAYYDPPIHIPNTYCEYYKEGGDGRCKDGIPFDKAWEKCLDEEDFKCMGVMWNPCKGETSDISVRGAWKLMSAGKTIGDAENPTNTCGGKDQALGHWDVFVRRSMYEKPPTTLSCNAHEKKVKVSVTTDNYPSESSWILQEFNGDLVATGGAYDNDYSTNVTELCIDLSQSCYTFLFRDSYGDGLFDGGSFSIKVEDQVFLSNPGTIAFSSLAVSMGQCPMPHIHVHSNINYSEDHDGKVAILSKNELDFWLIGLDYARVTDGQDIFDEYHIKESQGFVGLAKNLRTQKEGGLMIWTNSSVAFGAWNPREFSEVDDWKEGDLIELKFDKFDQIYGSKEFARDCTYTALTATGWDLPGESIRLGYPGLVGHYWNELEVEYEFDQAESIHGVWSDSVNLPYAIKYEGDNGEWIILDDDCKGTKIFDTPVSSKKWRLYWETTDLFLTGGLSTYRGGGGLHAELLRDHYDF